MEPAQTFLFDLLMRNGRVNSRRTWEVYGRNLYDFFAYVYTNKIDWVSQSAPGLPSALENYRDWSKGKLGLENSTINQRLRIVIRFYQWAVEKGHIHSLPFDRVIVQTCRPAGFPAHVDGTGGKVESPDVLLRVKSQNIRILTKEQVTVCYRALSNHTHKLMFQLMLRCGLRQIECRTFPENYVFDPSRRKDLTAGNMIRMDIHSAHMDIKNGKPRSIDMPYSLMEELWAYSVRHRQKRERNNKKGEKFPTLFLTEAGSPYGKDAVVESFIMLSRRIGFHVSAHMLRHSYATYLLWSLRKSKTFEGEPLLYVRDRLGHSDVTTTAGYLHLINSLEGNLVLAHESELDMLFRHEEHI